MARPVNADAAATRRRILESAQGLFADHGLGGCSMRAIARGAGVSVAMVHHYYGSKEELYSACVDSLYAELSSLRQGFESELGTATSLSDVIARAVRAGFRFGRAHSTANRMLLRQIVEAGELSVERREAMQRPFLEGVSQLLAGALARDAAELRLPLQSVVMLTSRYAISSLDELSFFVGLPDADEQTVLAAVESHLVRAAHDLLGVPPGADA